MCPACLSTAALIAAGAGSTGGLAAVVVRRIRKPAAQAPSHHAPAALPANEEEMR